MRAVEQGLLSSSSSFSSSSSAKSSKGRILGESGSKSISAIFRNWYRYRGIARPVIVRH